MPEKVTITKNKLDSLAEVIGSKSNQNVPLTIEGMEDAVLSLITPIGTKSITENGTYDVTEYANAEVDILNRFVITPTYAYNSNDGPTWTIDKTYDEVDAAYTAGKTIVVDAVIPFDSDYYEYCRTSFYSLEDNSIQSYTIMIGWHDWNDDLYHVYSYSIYSNTKTWYLNGSNTYEYPKSLIEKTITANGTYDPTQGTSGSYANGYSKVTVNVPPTTLQPLTITPSTEQQVFNASFQMSDTALMNELYLWKNNSTSFNILLTVGTNYWLILTRYSGNVGWTDSQISKVYDPVLWTATEDYSHPFSLQNESSVRVRYNSANNIGNNWRYKIAIYPVASSTAYAPVTVEPIPSEYTVPTLQAKTNINPTTSSQTITADSGYDGLSSVQINAMPSGTTGTPAAIKGTVSNNSITVTPSVTNTTGYITGGTKTGTAVAVSASELVSGTYNITSSGTKDITNYKNVSISSGTATVSATKGTVSNNSITVTPSVTTTEGYINANTSTGTAVTVSASELVSGTYSITENNTYDVTNIASVIVNVPTGGNVTQDANGYLVLDENGSSSNSGKSMDDPIRFFDYDGTLVASYTSVPSVLPINPSHTGLIAQGWNWSLADIATQFASSGTCDVGQMYTTSDGKTRIYITVSNVTKSFWLGLCPNGTLSIDWGDGSENSSMTGTSYLSIKTVYHEYATAGSYVISVKAESGEFAFYNSNSNFTQLFSKYESTGNYYNQPYGGCVTAIELGDGARVGNYAFSKLFNMRSITIPHTVTSIGTYAFQHCYALESITIPDSVTSIGTYTFRYCYALRSITIPNDVTNIGTYAFQHCDVLESITIPNNITSISIYTFQYCYALKSITIPDDVTSIGNYAFNSCYALRSITIPDDVTSIGNYAFNSCYTLKSITIPDDVTSIGNNTFQYCYALESITIPDSVTSISNNTFSNCYALKSITIPDDVTSIGSAAFSNCYNMDEYHLLPTTPPTLVNTTAFTNIQSSCKIYVPYSADHSILTAYQTAENWSTYASYMVEESE